MQVKRTEKNKEAGNKKVCSGNLSEVSQTGTCSFLLL